MKEKKLEQMTQALLLQLKQTAFFMKVAGENVFKVKAYEKAVENIENLNKDFYVYYEQQNFTDIKGIGAGIGSDIKFFMDKGYTDTLNEIYQRYPQSLWQLKDVKGLGPRKIARLYEDIQVSNLADLEYACHENRLIQMKGFGLKIQNNIIESIEQIKNSSNKLLLKDALTLFDYVQQKIQHCFELKNKTDCMALGDLARKCEIVDELSCLIVIPDICKENILKNAEALFDSFQDLEDNSNISQSQSLGSYELKQVDILNQSYFQFKFQLSSLPLKLIFVDQDFKSSQANNFKALLFELTCSNEHLQYLANNKALKKTYQNFPIEICEQPSEYYGFVDEKNLLNYFESKLASDSVQLHNIQGVFHMHSTYSDGKNTLEEMVQKAHDLGLKYIGISEHSETSFYANGLKKDAIEKQSKEIKKLRKKYSSMHILHGIEADILSNGDLDYDAKTLSQFDFVIASVHQNLKQSKEDMTKRLIKAIENPSTTILGHPTGRVLLGRNPSVFDFDAVVEAACKNNVLLEINANPRRLDLDWRYLAFANHKGAKFVISPDAHSCQALENTKFGVYTAQKAHLWPSDIANTLSFDDIKTHLNLGSLNQQ